MPTIKEIIISRNWGIRPNDNVIYSGKIWLVEKDEPYDLVQFRINELSKSYYWNESLCVKAGTSEEGINKLVQEYVEQISDKDIADYEKFLEEGERWGWD